MLYTKPKNTEKYYAEPRVINNLMGKKIQIIVIFNNKSHVFGVNNQCLLYLN